MSKQLKPKIEKPKRISPDSNFTRLHVSVSPDFHNLMRKLAKQKRQHIGYIVETCLSEYFNNLINKDDQRREANYN